MDPSEVKTRPNETRGVSEEALRAEEERSKPLSASVGWTLPESVDIGVLVATMLYARGGH